MTAPPPMRWQRGSYNCIVSGEYTICKFPAESGSEYFAYHQKACLGFYTQQTNADAAKKLCEEHARARE